ncbi:MAG: DUF1636 domain-containing protein [Albidovulum sp.]|uniref:DUF1636 family protein n=1 Tax=Albidovulum sp. TaxID=1872424 RepID=UPI003C7F1A1A
MSGVTVTVCRSCPAGQNGLAERLRAEIGGEADLREVDCMSGCTRPSTVAFRAAGKTAYLFGDITGADIPNLAVFLRLYSASPDGNLADARPLGSLREKAIARIPG